MGGARTPRRLYVPPTPRTERGGLLKGTDRAVTICQLPLQTVGIVDIQQLLANLDNMSTLVSDTLVSRVMRTRPDLLRGKGTFDWWRSRR